jgi:hypothetical protein
MVVRTVPCTEEIQNEEDRLVANALTVLVVGTRPSLAPYQVRRFIQETMPFLGEISRCIDTGLKISWSCSAMRRFCRAFWMPRRLPART